MEKWAALAKRGYMLRSKNDNWRTPQNVVDVVRKAFGGPIDLDPCGGWYSLVGAGKQYLLSKGQDGLALPWVGNVFVNPPFSTSKHWVAKAVSEAATDVDLILLLPARVDTKAFHEKIARSVDLIAFWKGRITFVGAPASAPFPVMFCYWGTHPRRFSAAFEKHAFIMKPRLPDNLP
jgi:site-specific DNA-methyltransferase (adenine-specific)